jgi:hypothetical protein
MEPAMPARKEHPAAETLNDYNALHSAYKTIKDDLFSLERVVQNSTVRFNQSSIICP